MTVSVLEVSLRRPFCVFGRNSEWSCAPSIPGACGKSRPADQAAGRGTSGCRLGSYNPQPPKLAPCELPSIPVRRVHRDCVHRPWQGQ
jgi:hypothetical protein